MRYGTYQGLTSFHHGTMTKVFEQNLLFPGEDRHLSGMTAGWRITRYNGTKGRTNDYETRHIHPIS